MNAGELSERLATSAAKGINRRRLFRRAGSVALGTAVATTYLGKVPEDVEAVCTDASPCGGAPRCAHWRCDSYRCRHGQTDSTGQVQTKWSCYGGGQCCTNEGVNNCWGAGSYFCCDCCAYQPSCRTGAPCSDCGSSGWYTCICLGPRP